MLRLGKIVIAPPSAPAPIVEPITQWLAQASEGFSAGQTVQLGATMLRVDTLPSGELTLMAPQPGSMPIVWQPDLGHAITMTARQRYAADSVGLTPQLDFVNPSGPCAISTHVGEAENILFSREEPLENGVSWFVSCPGLDPEDGSGLEVCSLYEAATRLSIFEVFWGLPIGAQVLLQPRHVRVRFGEQELAIPPDSFLIQFMNESEAAARWR